MSEYDLSPLGGNLEFLAFDLFRFWTAEVQDRLPDKNVVIRDESVLVLDMINSITAALNSLKESDPGNDADWQVQYFYGFVSSNLNYHWCYEYLKKQSNDFRMIVMLQTLQKYMISHETVRYEIGESYVHDLDESGNLQKMESEIMATLEAVQIQLEMPLIARIQSQLDHPLLTCLDNIISEKINDFAERKVDDYFRNIARVFPAEGVEKLIHINLPQIL